MLQRIYIDNFRQLVNFELSPGEINLFLGPNGSGKSSVFDVLHKIQTLIRGGGKVGTIFQVNDLTRWQKSQVQRFELEVKGNGGVYKYELAIEYIKKDKRTRIHHERLWFNDEPLLDFTQSKKTGSVYDNNGVKGELPFIEDQSILALLGTWNEKTYRFSEQIDRFIIVQIMSPLMESESQEESPRLSRRAENYTSWYRYIYQDQGIAIKITNALRDILDGFDHFKLTEAGEQHRVLRLSFNDGSEYRLDELSDGQRALIVLYSLLNYAQTSEVTLCIDEPENFLALSEIQPWLLSVHDLCSENNLQSLLISHHPEFINYLAASNGYWFDCQQNGPVRVSRIGSNGDAGIPMSELVARG